MVTTGRPELVFNMFKTDRTGIRLVADGVRRYFGAENYDEFRSANKKGEYIPQELRLRVDSQFYTEVGRMFHIRGGSKESERFWKMAAQKAIDTVNYARHTLFADQEKQATLTTNIAWSDGRPSSALEILTMPKRIVGEQCKYEQGIVLGLAESSAEVMSRNGNGHSRAMLATINAFLEDNLFIGRRGDPKKFHTFSYHVPFTNEVKGISSNYPDHSFEAGLWVKSLDYPVRQIGIRHEDGKIEEVGPALYDPREKEIESAVIKAYHRSLMDPENQMNGGIIETSPYAADQLGFRLVVMEGYPLRDKVTSYLEEIFQRFDGFERMRKYDRRSIEEGGEDSVSFNRRYIYIRGLNGPIEMMVFSLKDWLNQEYFVGNFNPEKGMHDGPAHDLYKLERVGDVAEYLWPSRIYGIDLAEPKKSASFEYATRLGRKLRIYPLPYAV